ncbi:MAG: hypothetical protein A2163_04050 [Actinobacteria bacterium RBG_13_35_12]|nr:MAG: hypothetical protein A2163_04050 [Actinobacteria bacterium RBG_13_35_12]
MTTPKTKMNKSKAIINIFLVFIIVFSLFGFTSTCKNKVVLTDVETTLLNLINQERIDNNLNALKINSKLTKLARYRSEDMIKNNYFSHYDLKGNRVICGEILGYIWGDKVNDFEFLFNGWLESKSHLAVILNPTYKNIGIGFSQNSTGDIQIVTILFSSR